MTTYRTDIFRVYRIITGKCVILLFTIPSHARSKGQKMQLMGARVQENNRTWLFTQQVEADLWNSLLSNVDARNLRTIKGRLDKYFKGIETIWMFLTTKLKEIP